MYKTQKRVKNINNFKVLTFLIMVHGCIACAEKKVNNVWGDHKFVVPGPQCPMCFFLYITLTPL